MAAFRCQTEAARLLLAKGADPNAPYSSGMAARFKSAAETPLDMAAQAGCLSVAQLLLEHGAKPNLIADWGVGGSAGGHDPALIHAIGKSEAVVRLLLDHGADPNLHAKYGVPALWQAASGCQGTIVGWLLERNAKVDEAGGSDMTPLMIAVQDGCDLVVTALLAKGAKVNQVDYSGETALYHLVNVGNFEDPKKLAIASALLKAGANPNLGLRKAQPPEPAVGITPLMLAVEHGMEETIRVLLENRADPNAVDSEGRNAIMHALQTDRPGENRAQSVELLLAHGAAVNTRDKRGTSALGYAKAWHGTEGQKIVELLRKAGGVE
jgi:serine/threonine-protein phosphatase 6 regulatory ankyrin repeat subunit A/cytohesin